MRVQTNVILPPLSHALPAWFFACSDKEPCTPADLLLSIPSKQSFPGIFHMPDDFLEIDQPN
jgi:hypothetical protein